MFFPTISVMLITEIQSHILTDAHTYNLTAISIIQGFWRFESLILIQTQF